MFEEEENYYSGIDIEKFEEMLSKNKSYYFDVDELEAIVEYYTEKGQNEKAYKAIELGRALHPHAAILTIKYAQVLAEDNKIDEALNHLKKVESLEPTNVDLFLARASILSKEGNHKLAVKTLLQGMQKTNEPDDFYPLIAAEFQLLGRFEEAVKYYKLSLASDPEDEMALYNLAICYDMLELNDKAIEFFTHYIDKNPYTEIAWYYLGVVYNKAKNYDKALWAFDYAIIIDEMFTAAYYEKARTLERLQRFEEAIQTYLDSFAFDTPTGFSYYRLGNCYRQINDKSQAKKYFTLAIKEDADIDEALLEMALIHLEEEKVLDAVQFIRRAVKVDPDNPDYLLVAIEILQKAELYDEAIEAYQKILHLGYKEEDIFIDYAELLLDVGKEESGFKVLEEGLRQHPQSANLHSLYGGYLFCIGEKKKAIDSFTIAKQLDQEIHTDFFNQFPHLKIEPEIRAVLG